MEPLAGRELPQLNGELSRNSRAKSWLESSGKLTVDHPEPGLHLSTSPAEGSRDEGAGGVREGDPCAGEWQGDSTGT